MLEDFCSMNILTYDCFQLLNFKDYEAYKVFTLLASKKVSLHSFMSTGRRSKTPELETKESLLLIAIAAPRISEFVSCPKSQIPQSQTKRYKSHLHVIQKRNPEFRIRNFHNGQYANRLPREKQYLYIVLGNKYKPVFSSEEKAIL